ncbi:hypothetical protein GmHk_04G010990 [Glycine max]|nr:hypothetical protein GmHk_04G010990 [Glycine max]
MKDAKVVMTRSKKVQNDFEKKEDSSPKVTNDILTIKDETPKKVKVPTDGNPKPKKEGIKRRRY